MKKQSKFTAWIVPTTHWDREWVMTQGQFQIRLTQLVDRLLDICEKHPKYRFYFDGQTIALEDYLEVRPENRDRLAELMQRGCIAAGPWYGLADQFIPGGEAVLRNLLEGRRNCHELGTEPVRLGYVPDSFGSNSALPMLLNEFDIRYVVFGRGRPIDKFHPLQNEFYWESLCGASVLAANFGYNGGVFLSYPDIWTDIRRSKIDPHAVLHRFMAEAAQQRKQAAGRHLYFSVGIDHMEARESLLEIVDYINSHQDEYILKFGLPTDYLSGVEKTANSMVFYCGEQCGSEKFPMNLTGTLSSHVKLKQANFRCEKLLAGAVEPLAVLAMRFAGKQYPEGMLRKMWKLLMANQTHDSICGCSIDQVHRDMITRYDFIENTSAYLIEDMALAIAGCIDTTSSEQGVPSVTVFNPLCRKRNAPVRSLVAVPRRCAHRKYGLRDSSGNTIAASLTRIAEKKMDLESVYMMPEQLATLLSKDADEACPDDQVFTVLEIDFVAHDLPACGWKTWWLTPVRETIKNGIRSNSTSMENEFIRVEFLPNGSFDMIDLRTDRRYRKVMRFVDREDAGNLYNHISLPEINEFDTSCVKAKISMLEKLSHLVTYKIQMEFVIPCELENGTKRATRNVNMPITVFVTLRAGIPRLELTIECENTAKDHCLHAVFATGIKTEVVQSDVAFDVVSRQVDSQEKTWRHRPVQHMIDASDGHHGFCVMPKGMYSQLATRSDDGTVDLHVTLLRCTGRLGPAAGADYSTPDGQCPGKHRFEVALMPHAGNWENGCIAAAMDYVQPVYSIASLSHTGNLPDNGSAINIAGSYDLAFCCLKKAETSQSIVFRCWNPGDIDIDGKFSGLIADKAKITEVHADETMSTTTPSELIIKKRGITTMKL